MCLWMCSVRAQMIVVKVLHYESRAHISVYFYTPSLGGKLLIVLTVTCTKPVPVNDKSRTYLLCQFLIQENTLNVP